MSKRVNPFNKNERGLKLYTQLKSDCETRSDNIFTSLPLFIRIVLLENSSWRYEQFNKYDLLNPFIVSDNFPCLITLSSEISYCRDINYVQGKCKPNYITPKSFLNEKFLAVRSNEYTVQDFIFSIAYNGSIHMEPSSESEHEKYIRIYNDFVEKYSDLAFNLILDIASSFVQSFHEIYESFSGSKHFMSPEHHHQPMVCLGGEIIKVSNEIALSYSEAYSQVAVDKLQNSGIRICLHLKLCKNSGSDKHYIFCYGNRKDLHSIRIACYYAHDRIFVTAKRQSSTKSKQVIIPIENFMVNDLFWLEVALYPKGFFVVAVNEVMQNHEDIGDSFSIYDGKVIVGASLEGNNFGRLNLTKLFIEIIDRSENTNLLSSFALRKVQAYNRRNLSHMLMKRPINVIF